MLVIIGETIDAFNHWVDSCPCHSSAAAKLLSSSATKHFIKVGLKGDFGGAATYCPNVGRWAPEFAAGRWLVLLQSMFGDGYGKVLQLCVGLSEEQRSALLGDWNTGRKIQEAPFHVPVPAVNSQWGLLLGIRPSGGRAFAPLFRVGGLLPVAPPPAIRWSEGGKAWGLTPRAPSIRLLPLRGAESLPGMAPIRQANCF